MEGRKQRRVKKIENEVNHEAKRSSSAKKIGIISKILMTVLTVAIIAVLGMVIYLKVLPNKYLIPLCILVVAVCAIGTIFVFRKKTHIIAILKNVFFIFIIITIYLKYFNKKECFHSFLLLKIFESWFIVITTVIVKI